MTTLRASGCLRVAAGLLVASTLASPPAALSAPADASRDAWVAEASVGLPPPVLDALAQIAGADRRLLALRSYLKAGDGLNERWSWSEEQQLTYPSTAEGKTASVELDAVAAAFAAANPGFTLRVNRAPRSLEAQIIAWNDNESVAAAAAACGNALERRFGAAHARSTAAALRLALLDWQPNHRATLAAPGLSAHGQARAFDFQVERGAELVAGTDSASARTQWDAAGWTQKLHTAVGAAGAHFSGPLQSPYEPWHYAYVPAAPRPL
jgi:hypothetical protein